MKTKEHKDILNRVSKTHDIRSVMQEANASATEVADVLLKFKSICSKQFGGTPIFTGDTKVYRSGAIGHKVRCRKCKREYWITNIPYALCVDCDPGSLFRD